MLSFHSTGTIEDPETEENVARQTAVPGMMIKASMIEASDIEEPDESEKSLEMPDEEVDDQMLEYMEKELEKQHRTLLGTTTASDRNLFKDM